MYAYVVILLAFYMALPTKIVKVLMDNGKVVDEFPESAGRGVFHLRRRGQVLCFEVGWSVEVR